MRKLSVYVETSVWSQAFAEDAPDIRQATEQFFAEAREGRFELFVSDVVMGEINRASEDLAQRLHGLVAELAPVLLKLDEGSLLLSQEFLNSGAVPASKVDDARHVAVALTNDLDVLVSWNYRHLVNVRRREIFHQVGVMNGYYKPLQIVPPPEVSDVAQ
jgi:predicted nucleic acid-binding protein